MKKMLIALLMVMFFQTAAIANSYDPEARACLPTIRIETVNWNIQENQLLYGHLIEVLKPHFRIIEGGETEYVAYIHTLEIVNPQGNVRVEAGSYNHNIFYTLFGFARLFAGRASTAGMRVRPVITFYHNQINPCTFKVEREAFFNTVSCDFGEGAIDINFLVGNSDAQAQVQYATRTLDQALKNFFEKFTCRFPWPTGASTFFTPQIQQQQMSVSFGTIPPSSAGVPSTKRIIDPQGNEKILVYNMRPNESFRFDSALTTADNRIISKQFTFKAGANGQFEIWHDADRPIRIRVYCRNQMIFDGILKPIKKADTFG